jgi:proteasome lid subunit RPN8/RPN11
MTQTRWFVPEDLMANSLQMMRPHGALGNEGLALWFGTGMGARAEVQHIVEVRGAGFRTSPLFLSLSMRAMASLTDLADRLGAYLIGQIHSHPGTLLNLSELDEEYGIRVPDYLSVVCPYYAQRDSRFEECGIHVFEGRSYRRMNPAEVDHRITVTTSRANKILHEVPA